jgi:DNA-binding SARP family transcriptional activator
MPTSPRSHRHDRPVTRLRKTRGTSLQPGKAVGIDTLIEHVWGESPPEHAAETISKYVRTVRHELARCGGRPDWLRPCHPRGYMLDVDPELVDHVRFTRMVHSARHRAEAGDAVDAIRRLREAMQLFQGEPLSNVSGDWAERQRHAIELERLAAHIDLLEQQLLDGQYAQVASGVQAIISERTPTDQLIILGMYALARSGPTCVACWRHWLGRTAGR